MTTLIHRLVDACRAGNAPQVIARVPSGWAVMGSQQVLRGYSLLLPDPVVPHLNALSGAARMAVLADAARFGDALLAVTGARRVNYAIFGNQEPALHVHLVPRYDDEPDALRTGHPWNYDWVAAPRFAVERDGELVLALRQQLQLAP